MNKTEKLKQAYLAADQEYRFAFVSGDPSRLVAALRNRRSCFDAYNKVKKREFMEKENRKLTVV